MSKHLGPLLKIDNTGTKWYRKVSNVGAAAISVGTLCEFAYDHRTALTYTLQNLPTLSSDYNLVRPVSAGATAQAASGVLAGVAIENINAYSNIRDTGLPTGWVQFKGICPVSTRCSVIAGRAVQPSSSSNATGVGFVMQVAEGATQAVAASSMVGVALSTAGKANGNGWTWVYLNI